MPARIWVVEARYYGNGPEWRPTRNMFISRDLAESKCAVYQGDFGAVAEYRVVPYVREEPRKKVPRASRDPRFIQRRRKALTR